MIDGGWNLGPGLEWDCPDDDLVVDCSKSSSNEGTHPENPLCKTQKEKPLLDDENKKNLTPSKSRRWWYRIAYMVIPSMAFVVDDGSSKAPGWVDASSCDGDGGQVHQENSKPNRERSKDL